MSYTNCMGCNKIINYQSGPVLCRACDEKLFKIVKEYLKENPTADVKKINEDTKVPLKVIKAFIKDERLETIRVDVLKCSLCGDAITGDSMYCSNCLKKIKTINALNGMCFEQENKNKEQDEKSNRMHYYGVKKR